MEKYIEGNKAAWEEAFDNRDASRGADITERIQNVSGQNSVLFINILRNRFPVLCSV